MTDFPESFLAYRAACSFNLLCISSDERWSKRVLSRLTDMLEFNKALTATSPQAGFRLFGEADLRQGKSNECLLVVWECRGQDIAEQAADFADQGWSGQVVFCAVSNNPLRLRHKDFAALIAENHCWAGDEAAFFDTVQRLTIPDWRKAAFPNFDLPFKKTPSTWVRQFKHDYFNLVYFNLEVIKASDLLPAQLEIDLLQNALRNLLVFRLENGVSLGLKHIKMEPKGFGALKLQRCVLLCPGRFADQLPSFWEEGLDFELYSNRATLEERLAAKEAGCVKVLILDSNEIDEESFPFVGQNPVCVYTGENELERTWPQWQKLLRQGLAGAFCLAEWWLDRESQRHLLGLKKEYWKLLATFSLPQIFDRLAELLLETHAGLQGRVSESSMEKIFRSWASLMNAKALYLGIDPQSESLRRL